jgi:tRNA (guanine37-N1)-methyltransferase
MAGLVEGPVYTKPSDFQGRTVPAVLRSGDHGAIARWRRDQALMRTAHIRPDLLAGRPVSSFDAADASVLEALGWCTVEGCWVAPSG